MDSAGFGANQFAYTKRRGFGDALLFNLCNWISAIESGHLVGLYCSDVSGAFDRVESERLLAKWLSCNLHPKLLKLISSWLEFRHGFVVVNGPCSVASLLRNKFFQGTVWGPGLWNTFFGDARRALHSRGFTKTTFADDMHCFKLFDRHASTESVFDELHSCQSRLHECGAANRVKFDLTKESFHIVHSQVPAGDPFTILGTSFDTKLFTHGAVRSLVVEEGWKLKTILRCKPFYSAAALFQLYKDNYGLPSNAAPLLCIMRPLLC